MSYGPDLFPPPPPRPGADAVSHRAPTNELPRLRSSYRFLRRTMTLAALGYFLAFLLLTGYAPDVMETEVLGSFTLGLLMGLLQFPVTVAAIVGYERSAVRTVDPLARGIRHAVERSGAPAGRRGAQAGHDGGRGGSR